MSVGPDRGGPRSWPTIVTVQNLYNLANRKSEDVLDYCEAEGIGFIPWFPLATGDLAQPGGPLARAAERLNATPSQVALAWLLHRSPVMLPIPGTSRVKHLEENTARRAARAGRGDDAGARSPDRLTVPQPGTRRARRSAPGPVVPPLLALTSLVLLELPRPR